MNIIIRGHGTGDQHADVFATLCTYAGIPAFWTKVEPQGLPIGLILAFALVDSRWVVFDVANGIAFRNDRDELATVEDLRGRSDLIPPAARELKVQEIPYRRFLEDLRLPPVPSPLRAELQMPWQRLRFELARALGRTGD